MHLRQTDGTPPSGCWSSGHQRPRAGSQLPDPGRYGLPVRSHAMTETFLRSLAYGGIRAAYHYRMQKLADRIGLSVHIGS